MKHSSPGRSDIVVGMTLAEVFLLLLLVGWYGSRLESQSHGRDGEPGTVSKTDFDRSDRLRRDAEAKLTQKIRDYEQLERILEWIAKTAGLPKPITNLDDAKAAVDTITSNAKRGRPACFANNVLVSVIADSGDLIATVRQAFRGGRHRYLAGQRLTQRSEIELFLQDVEEHYSERRREAGSVCVFDFTLLWRSDADYRSARELFEQHFYPAGIRRLR